MRRVVKWLGVAIAALVLAAGGVLAVAWLHAERAMARVYPIDDAPLALAADAGSIAHGRHLFDTRGCGDCHDGFGQGRMVFESGPLMRLVAPNITPRRLAARGYDAAAIAAAIRHGVRADGTPLRFMPSTDWSELSDADTAALVSYIGTLPDSDNDPGTLEVRWLARVLHLFDRLPLLPAEAIDHRPRRRGAPAVAVSVEYGGYIAQTCAGCHRTDFAGGPPIAPGTPPVANLTPAALGAWSEADFLRAMREGRRPDGRELDGLMPWRMFAKMTDTELRALWRYLQQLPPRSAAS
jgi:mono/diheme cytochrome c family protein